MVEFGTTSNGSFETNKKWSGIRKHLEHDVNVKHKNKYLETAESKRLRKYNKTINLVDFDKWTEKHFKDYVFEHDKKNLDKSRFVFGSVKNFLRVDTSGKTRKKSLDKLYLMKFSNEEDYQKLFKKVKQSFKDEQKLDNEKAEEKAILLFRTSLENYTRGFNKRNTNIIAFCGTIHMDEEGAPHVHLRTMPYVPPKKPTEKPKWAINQALREQYKHKDTRTNLKDFRKQEDTSMIDCVNEEIEKQLPELSKNLHLKLIRKEQTESVTHEVYLEREHLKDVQKQVEIEQKKLEETKKKNEELDEREKSLQVREKFQNQTQIDLDEYQSNLDKREQELNKREHELTDRENKFSENMTKSVIKFNRTVKESNKKFHDKNDELNKKNQDVNDKINELNQQINEVKTLRQRLTDKINKFEEKTKDVVQSWRDLSFNLSNRIYQKCVKYFKSDVDVQNNDGYNELGYYDKHIDEIPDNFDEEDWFKHQDDKKFSWVTDEQQYNRIVEKSEKIINEHNKKKLDKQKKDLNNDGIDDSQENFLKTIDVTDFDPLLQINNEEEQQNQDENEKH